MLARTVAILMACQCSSSTAPSSSEARSLSTTCGPRDEAGSSARVIRHIRSERLRRASERLRRGFLRLRLAAPGIDRSPAGSQGRSYLQIQWQLSLEACDSALDRAVRRQLGGPAPDEALPNAGGVFYSEVTRLTHDDGASERSFAPQDELRGREADRLRAAAGTLWQLSRRLRLVRYQVHAGWADAIGSSYHGIALVDPATREALWTFSEEVWNEI